jgi:hypothetical protein
VDGMDEDEDDGMTEKVVSVVEKMFEVRQRTEANHNFISHH